jgi:hypothetical protein
MMGEFLWLDIGLLVISCEFFLVREVVLCYWYLCRKRIVFCFGD